MLHHGSVREVVNDVLLSSVLNFIVIFLLHSLYHQRRWVKSNIRDFLDLFTHQDVSVDVYKRQFLDPPICIELEKEEIFLLWVFYSMWTK